MIRAWIPAGERGTLNAIFNSGSYAGPALCAVAAGPIIATFGWRALFFLAGGIGFLWLACWLIWYSLPEDSKWLSRPELDKIVAERDVKKVASGADAKQNGRLLSLLGSGPTLWGLALTQGCNVYSQYLFLTWLPSYLQHTKGLTIAKTGFYAAIPYAIAVVLCILIGRVSDRLLRGDVGGGKRRYMIASAMLLAATILFAPYLESVWLILGLIALSLTGVAATTSLNFALLNDLLPNPKDVGVAMAFLVVGGNTFGLLAPIVTGYVIAGTGSYDSHAAGIAITPDGRYVFVSNRGHDSVSTFRIDYSASTLAMVATTPSGGRKPRFITLDPSGQRLFVANEDDDCILSFRIEAGGRLSPTGDPIFTGSPVCILFASRRAYRAPQAKNIMNLEGR